MIYYHIGNDSKVCELGRQPLLSHSCCGSGSVCTKVTADQVLQPRHTRGESCAPASSLAVVLKDPLPETAASSHVDSPWESPTARQVSFPQASERKSETRYQRWKPQSPGNLVLEVTSHHFHNCYLLEKSHQVHSTLRKGTVHESMSASSRCRWGPGLEAALTVSSRGLRLCLMYSELPVPEWQRAQQRC